MPRTSGQRGLFERLEPVVPAARPRRRQQDALAEQVGAIKRHLTLILNARRGGSISAPELGLGDVNDIFGGSADMHLRMCEDIRRNIIVFEPRVKNVSVHPICGNGMDSRLHFRIRCTVPLHDAEEQVEIELRGSPQGKLTAV